MVTVIVEPSASVMLTGAGRAGTAVAVVGARRQAAVRAAPVRKVEIFIGKKRMLYGDDVASDKFNDILRLSQSF